MPRRAGIWVEPGRERERERKRAEGANATGVMEKRLEAHAAPSGEFVITGGMESAIMELSGSARPRMPLKSEDMGSLTMVSAAARGHRDIGKDRGDGHEVM